MKHFQTLAIAGSFLLSFTAVCIATESQSTGNIPSTGGQEAAEQQKSKDDFNQQQRGETSLKREADDQQSQGKKDPDPLEKERDRAPGIGPSSGVGAGQ